MVDVNSIDLKNNLLRFKEDLLISKKYWIIYLCLVLFFITTNFNLINYLNPFFELIVLTIVSFGGVFCIVYYFGHNDDEELYKTAFIIILIFGILCSLLMPIGSAPDEYEHIVRAEITSQGSLVPEYENGSYSSIRAISDLMNSIHQKRGEGYNLISVKNATVFTNDVDTLPINYSEAHFVSAFAQNPFYGYLAQALGIIIAKLLDLNTIWLLWMGRICNLLLYAGLISYAVKKTPIIKVPFIIMACIPLALYQSSSMSIDALINGLAFIIIAYFFHMYKSPINSLTYKETLIFTVLCLLLGLTKITFFLFIFLLLLVPRGNFKKTKYYYFSLISICALGIIGYIWTTGYAQASFNQSYRLQYWIDHNVSSTNQLSYIFDHKKDFIVTVLNIPQYWDIDLIFNSRDLYFNSFNSLYLMFLGSVILMYPIKKQKLELRIGLFVFALVMYVATYLTFLFTWTPAGQFNPIVGVQPRYFLPLFVLLPVIFSFNRFFDDKKRLDGIFITLTISFLALMIISLIGNYY